MAAGTVTELSTDINRVVDVDTGSLLATDTSPLDRGGLRFVTCFPTWNSLLNLKFI